MKNKITVLCMLCILMLSFTVGVFAKDDKPNVDDAAGVLTNGEVVKLEELISNIQSEHKVDVVLVTTDEKQEKTLKQFAEDYYEENNYGLGKNGDGIILVISLDTYDWQIVTKGYCTDIMTEQRYASFEQNVLPFLSKQQYNKAFVNYLTELNGYLAEGVEGVSRPKGFDTTDSIILSVVISIIIGLLVSWGISFLQKRKMKSILPELDPMGEEMVVSGKFKLQAKEDILANSDVTKALKLNK